MSMSVFKVFVINLNESIERLERLKFEFERIGLDFERIPAVDGRKLSENQIFEHYSSKLNRKKYFVPLSKPEIGLYMSHLKACEKIISENLDFGIILEDDIVLKEGFQIVPQVLSSLKHKWNYIKLIAPGKKKKIKARIQIPVELPVKLSIEKYSEEDTPDKYEKNDGTRNIKIPAIFEVITWNKPPIGTSAYAITLDGAKEFLSKRSIFFRPIDVDLQYEWETSLKIQGLRPFFLDLLGDESTVQTCKLKYHYPLARLVYKLRYTISSILFHK